jgi:hypothetical protein
VPPRYQRLAGNDVALLSSQDGGALLRLIAGDLAGNRGPGSTYTPITMVHASVSPEAEVAMLWPAAGHALVYALAGRVTWGRNDAHPHRGAAGEEGRGVPDGRRWRGRMPELLAAAVAGVLAAQFMEVPAYPQKALGLPVRQDIFAEAGAILRAEGRWRRPVGWLLHATTAASGALLYAVFFSAVGAHDRLVVWGVVGGVVHFVIVGWSSAHSRCCIPAFRRSCRRPALVPPLRLARRDDVPRRPSGVRRPSRTLLRDHCNLTMTARPAARTGAVVVVDSCGNRPRPEEGRSES